MPETNENTNIVVCAKCGRPVNNFPGWLARTNIKAICEQCRTGHPPAAAPSDKAPVDAADEAETLRPVDLGEHDDEGSDESVDLDAEDPDIPLDDVDTSDDDIVREDN
ncbi:MAG: hypothetical protein IT210_02290 [Armatimonadetes bacterium]|nr:hypothetical protein [Armatimonadota bacterium]